MPRTVRTTLIAATAAILATVAAPSLSASAAAPPDPTAMILTVNTGPGCKAHQANLPLNADFSTTRSERQQQGPHQTVNRLHPLAHH